LKRGPFFGDVSAKVGLVAPLLTIGENSKIHISPTEKDIDTKPKPFDSAQQDAYYSVAETVKNHLQVILKFSQNLQFSIIFYSAIFGVKIPKFNR